MVSKSKDESLSGDGKMEKQEETIGVNPIAIGNVVIKNNLFLAQMAGVSDLPFRLICRRYGAGLTYSEMVSAKALHYGDEKTKRLVRHDGESPFAVQIFGNEPQIIAEAARYVVNEGADIVDINMGCPAPKIVNNSDGSALMKDPVLCGEIVAAAVKAVSCPVTVKIRLGWSGNNALEVARILEENGAAAVCVHGRTREQQYAGRADWNAIAQVKCALTIPVIANGDVYSREDFERILEITGCDAVMVGRGTMGNPWIFSEILDGTPPPTPQERIRQALEHTELLVKYKGAHIGILESRKHVCWYLKGIPGGGKVRQAVNSARNLGEMRLILSDLEKESFC